MIKKTIFLWAVLASCQSDPESTIGNKENDSASMPLEVNSNLDHRAHLNISLLVDLSDRIDPIKNPNATMQYFQRDTGYIASVVRAFNGHVLNKKLLLIDDRLQTFIDPLPQSPTIVQNLEALKIELNRDNVTKKVLKNLPNDYVKHVSLLYQQAIKDNHYVGSDTWRFFKSSAKGYCVRKNAQNVLVVLTDGYIYHQNSVIKEGGRRSNIGKRTFRDLGLTSSNWQAIMDEKDLGFITPEVDLSGLKILVLGLNPSSGNPYEEDVLIAYWTKWLKEMGADDFLIKTTDLPVNLEESIREFVLSSKLIDS